MVNIVDTDVCYTLRVKRINPKSYPKGKKKKKEKKQGL